MVRTAMLLLAVAAALASATCSSDPTAPPPRDAARDAATDTPSRADAPGDGPRDAPRPDADAALAPDGLPDLGPIPWRDKAWTHRKRLTVKPGKVTATLKDFPLLVALAADQQLAAGARSNGADIHFTAADGQTVLDHEIERFDDKSGTLVAWVRIPTLSSTKPTTLFLYYGNPAASSPQNAAAVFASGYEAVWHLHGAPTASVSDATAKHPGTSRGGMTGGQLVTAKIGEGYQLDGIDDAVDVGAVDLTPDGPGDDGLTLEAWVRADNVVGRIISKATGTAMNEHWWMCALGDGSSFGGYHFRIKTSGSTTWHYTGSTPPLATWMHLAFTYDGLTMRIYKDGAPLSVYAKLGTVATSSSVKVSIGDNPVGDRHFKGILDEVRLSRVARTAAWLQTQHANQSAPSNFYALGPEVQAP